MKYFAIRNEGYDVPDGLIRQAPEAEFAYMNLAGAWIGDRPDLLAKIHEPDVDRVQLAEAERIASARGGHL